MVKAIASRKVEKRPKTNDQELPLSGQRAREPACFVRSRRSPGVHLKTDTLLPQMAYFYTALMAQFVTTLDISHKKKALHNNISTQKHISG